MVTKMNSVLSTCIASGTPSQPRDDRRGLEYFLGRGYFASRLYFFKASRSLS